MSAPSTDFVPTIDISSYLKDPDSTAAQDVISTIRTALRRSGFFQITNHGIPSTLQDSLFDAAGKYFALPVSEKMKLPLSKSVGVRGYDPIATQSYGPDSTGDLKESFFIGCDLPMHDPNVTKRRIFSGPNVWPDALSDSDFRKPLEAHYKAVTDLTLKVLEMVARSLPEGTDVGAALDAFTKHPIAAPMRLLHYPPQPATTEKGKERIGASSHTDFGAITLLLQHTNEGLHIFNKEEGNGLNDWVPVPPLEGAYVVNAGDILERWTNGDYKSAQHRVVNASPTKDRYSVAYFLEGNLDCRVQALSSDKENGHKNDDSFTVEEHMIDRLSSSYSGEEGYGEK